MDHLSPAQRSWNMSRIRGRDSAPERTVRSLLHRGGFRFRLHRRSLPGTPDIVLPRYRTVIFVHGCFWHRHEGCRFAYMPKTREAFWSEKFSQNRSRDARVAAALKCQGWRVLVVWECEIRNTDRLARRLADALREHDGTVGESGGSACEG